MDRYAQDRETRFAWVKYALLGALTLVTVIVVFIAVTR